MFMALILFGVNVTVGALGFLTWRQRGPLYPLNIPLERLQGKYINLSNISALISALAAILTIGCGFVYVGISRAWLWRRTRAGDGITISRWRAAASGGGIWRLIKAPLMAGGIALMAVAGAGLMSSAWAGVLVPNIKSVKVTGDIINMPSYAGNSDTGGLISCLDPLIPDLCVAIEYGDISEALAFGTSNRTVYQLLTTTVDLNGSYTAGLVGNLNGYADMSIPVIPQPLLIQYRSVGMTISTTCKLITDTGYNSDTSMWYYNSSCFPEPTTFGNASNTFGTYSTATGCPQDDSYIFEYGIAGSAMAYSNQTLSTNPLAFSCRISANEGQITSNVVANTVTFSDFVPGNQLTGEEIRPFATALIVAVAQDGAIKGKLGIVSSSIGSALRPMDKNGNILSAPDMNVAARIVSVGASAAASGGYLNLLPGQSTWTYTNVQNGTYDYYYNAYGWVGHESMLAWSTISVLIALVWLVTIFYMARGGTAYDPTDWFQTMNTGAGSHLAQVPGTCTGAGLKGKHFERMKLWYGEIADNHNHNHIGFSHSETIKVDQNKVYGGHPSTTV